MVGGCLGVVDALQGDHVQRPVELAIAAAVESVAVLFAAGGVDGGGARECCEGGLAGHSAGIAAGDEQLCRAHCFDAALAEQVRRRVGDDDSEAAVDFGDLVGQALDRPAIRAQASATGLGRSWLACLARRCLDGGASRRVRSPRAELCVER